MDKKEAKNVQFTNVVRATLEYGANRFKSGKSEEAEIVALLNDKGMFRTFGDGLLYLIKQKNPSLDNEAALEFLKKSCKSNGVTLKEIGCENTIKNWLNEGMRPSKGENTRHHLFALAFALNLNVEETVYLFERVYLDRAFNYRNQNELICYYCLENNKTWADVNRIIAKVDSIETINEGYTIATNQLKATFDTISTEEELINFIVHNRYNIFTYERIISDDSKMNSTAKHLLQDLIEKAKDETVEEELDFQNVTGNERFDSAGRNRDAFMFDFLLKYYRMQFYGRKIDPPSRKKPSGMVVAGYCLKHLRDGNENEYKALLYFDKDKDKKIKEIMKAFEDKIDPNAPKTSTAYMYYMITGQHPKLMGIKSVFKNFRLPDEIKNRFPRVSLFAEDELTYETLRKMIILLYSYLFWRDYHNKKIVDSRKMKAYVDGLNQTLDMCGFSELYYGNPYDWLFLYCTSLDYSLETFRAMLKIALEGKDNKGDGVYHNVLYKGEKPPKQEVENND